MNEDATPSLSEDVPEPTNRVDEIIQSFEMPEDVVVLPLKPSNMRFVVANLANTEQNPICAVPAFRLWGLFSTVATASLWAKETFPEPDENLFVIPSHELFPICATTSAQGTESYTTDCIKAILSGHEKILETCQTIFKDQSSQLGESKYAHGKRQNEQLKSQVDTFQKEHEQSTVAIADSPRVQSSEVGCDHSNAGLSVQRRQRAVDFGLVRVR